MTAKKKRRLKQLRDLQRNGVDAQSYSHIQFNSGSETSQHLICKAFASYWLDQAGWVVNGEVTVEGRGEVDILAWGRQGYMSYCVEVETSPPEDVAQRYLEQYIHGTPIDELVVLNCNAMPNELDHASAWVADQLPVEL
jgi:hypothetical protein